MSRRFLHRWLGHWSLMLVGMAVILAVLWGATREDLLAASLITVASCTVPVVLGWFATKEG